MVPDLWVVAGRRSHLTIEAAFRFRDTTRPYSSYGHILIPNVEEATGS